MIISAHLGMSSPHTNRKRMSRTKEFRQLLPKLLFFSVLVMKRESYSGLVGTSGGNDCEMSWQLPWIQGERDVTVDYKRDLKDSDSPLFARSLVPL